MYTAVVIGQNKFFNFKQEASFKTANQARVIVPEKYKTVALDMPAMQAHLATVPKQADVTDKNKTPIIELPMPDGSIAKFHIWERSVMEAELAAQFPTYKTYIGQGINDKSAVLVMDVTDAFHAMITSSISSSIFIDAYDLTTTSNYISYYKKDLKPKNSYREDGNIVDLINTGIGSNIAQKFPTGQCRSNELRTYRLALSCTGEYAQVATGKALPTVAETLAKIVTTINRVNSVYEVEAGIHLNLVANETAIIYTDTLTDPYTGNSNQSKLINEVQNNITTVIGSGNFDIGHIFSTGTGGIAGLGVVCNDAQKAIGVCGILQPTGDGFDIDYVAHEMGHQFGANHTFNAGTLYCGGNGNRTPTSAATNCEPGGGSTLMSYAGICSINNLQQHNDPQFHAASLAEIYKFIVTGTGSTCGVISTVTNAAPVVAIPVAAYNIPINTPFALFGTATDADGDTLTYSWEEIDVAGPFGDWNALPQVPLVPLFRSFPPKATGVRYFPKPSDLDTITIGERLPSIARTMKFRLTVRDNNASCGGTCYADKTVTVNAASAAFAVSYPNTGTEIWTSGETRTVTWNKGSTNLSPYNVTKVTIELSIDGGYTYPYTLKDTAINNGACSITVPNVVISTKGRVRVSAIGNIFYDISDKKFAINTCLLAPTTNSITITGLDSAVYQSVTYTSSTTVSDTIRTIKGCDSIYTIANIIITKTPQNPVVTGNIYLDPNSNALHDILEPFKSNVKVQLSNGNYTFTDNNGYYQIQADSIGSYTLTVTPPAGYTALPASVTYNFTSYDTTVTRDIALQPAVVLDSVAINVIPMVMNAVQGGAMPYWVEFTNAGTTTLSPTVALTYNNYLLAYDSCTDANAIPVANGVVTSALNMQPGITNNFISYFTVKPSANVGDTLTTLYSIATTSINKSDSFYMIIEGGVAAPNAQRVTTSITTAEVASGKDIVYTIGFKNTGNDTAYNVVITDTLSNLLKANTVQMISSSHTCKTTVKGNIVTFELLNIKLPKATTNSFKSLGFVSFKVKPLPTLVAGNIIINKANTYYNYRAAQSSIATTIVKNIITPVRITNYELRMTSERQITNYWTTSTEINTSQFNIQRSEDGKAFKAVGSFAAKGVGEYQFTDELKTKDQLPKTLYYRLEVVDKDGSKTYSEIKQIRLNQLTNQLINVYPNPAKDVVTISSKEGIKEIKFINQLGQTIKQLNNPAEHQTINTQQFAKGVYIVKITTTNGEIKNKKLILE